MTPAGGSPFILAVRLFPQLNNVRQRSRRLQLPFVRATAIGSSTNCEPREDLSQECEDLSLVDRWVGGVRLWNSPIEPSG